MVSGLSKYSATSSRYVPRSAGPSNTHCVPSGFTTSPPVELVVGKVHCRPWAVAVNSRVRK
ncbi:hypothetical protein [Lysobacter gummosus]|uniref:hypothetical protein n=1 Tax=Lysobacter gummosus TaxID=262324 RepID=UPI003630147C